MSNPNDSTTHVAPEGLRIAPRSASEPRFAPGTLIAGRFRIASILGAGGMGEVYRADDVRLGQPVALKFLPARLARDPVLLARLHDEVRLGRQVAHPNVCRIYDIIDWEGSTFLSMEFVDGEDLSRLLRRIGRLPHDKAIEISRGIAAGLMAAHAKGILHRDLKPANVMLDSHGDARIMDFGLALGTGDDDGTISGTPAYLAPEVAQGAPASISSDLYALGLVMYELFTGARVHSSRTFPERLREIGSEVHTPSSLIREIDAAVERVILRCLSSDPAQRPRSAREVIEALPGGDPLAAALAAGETPSPRLVAAAGNPGTLSRKAAWSWLGLIAALMTIYFAIVIRGRYLTRYGLFEPPEVHASRATELLHRIGVPLERFRTWGFEEMPRHNDWIQSHPEEGGGPDRFSKGLPVVAFWLRSTPEPLIDRGALHTPAPGVGFPPQTAPGSVTVEVDPHGRLVSLSAIPAPSWEPRKLDWAALLREAGIANAGLTNATPIQVPPAFADARAAWTGKHTDGSTIRVEAASFRGVPVHFRISGPWDAEEPAIPVPFRSGRFNIFITALVGVAIVVGAVLAWRNARARRGDRSGSLRIGALLFVASMVEDFAGSSHATLFFHELRILITALEHALVVSATFYVVYLALEPMIRRHWPELLISWARAIGGNVTDPLVGRDVMIGIAAGIAHSLIATASRATRAAVHGFSYLPSSGNTIVPMASSLGGLERLGDALGGGIIQGMSLSILLMLLTILLRRRRLAGLSFFLVLFGGYLLASTDAVMIPFFTAIAVLLTMILSRAGLLSVVALQFTFLALFFTPLPDTFAWYTARGLFVPAVILLLAIFAFRFSLGGQSAFADEPAPSFRG